ncbi:MAG: enoyl-CoA hydratase [Acidovorax sp.]|nr:enoyl-CoA hydratase [Acidovorax sp.]
MKNTTQGTSPAPLLLERSGAIATLRFNRPDTLNAIDAPMARAFLAAVQAVAADPGVRAVVLCGSGRGFMAGGDLATLRAQPVQGAIDILTPLNQALLLLAQTNAPVIAQVHGVAAGAGLSLLLMADHVLMAEGTRLNLAYIHLGTSGDAGATWALPRLVGLRKALEMALLGDAFTADEALRLGLVNRVVPAAELQAATDALAQRIANGPTLAYGAMKRLMRESMDRTLAAQLEAEKDAFVACAATADFQAGVEAFHARQPPVFRGC